MEPIVNKAKGFDAAEQWDIEQQINLTPSERREIAYQLKRRVYGDEFSPLRKNRVVKIQKGFIDQTKKKNK